MKKAALFFTFLILVVGSAMAVYQVTPGLTINKGSSIYHCAVSSDGGYLAMGGESDSKVFIYNLTNETQIGSYSLPGGAETESIDMSDDGSLVVIGTQGGGGVYCVDKTGTFLWNQPAISGEVSVSITPDGSRIFAGGIDTFYRLDPANGNIITSTTINTSGWAIWGVSTNNDGDVILLRTNSDVILVDKTGTEIDFYDVTPGNALIDAHLSPDGSEFVVSYRILPTTDYEFALYDIPGGLDWVKPASGSTGCRIDQEGRVYTSTFSDLNRIWNNNGTEIINFGSPSFFYMDVSQDGTVFADAYTPEDIQVYDIQDVYSCYPDLYMPAYLVDIDENSSPVYDYYTLTITSWADLPDELFVGSPELPACGLNTDASRTYVRIYGDNGLSYGFNYCAVYDQSFFEELTVRIPKADPKPDHFYVQLWDRKCDLYMDSGYAYAAKGCPLGDLNGDCIVNLEDYRILAGNWLLDNN